MATTKKLTANMLTIGVCKAQAAYGFAAKAYRDAIVADNAAWAELGDGWDTMSDDELAAWGTQVAERVGVTAARNAEQSAYVALAAACKELIEKDAATARKYRAQRATLDQLFAAVPTLTGSLRERFVKLCMSL